MNSRSRFTIGFLATFTLSALYPFTILFHMGFKGLVWIKNDPAFSCFVLFLLPLAVGIFAAIFDARKVTHLPSHLKILAISSFVVAQIATAGVVFDDSVRQTITPPFLMQDYKTALAADSAIRQNLPLPRQLMLKKSSDLRRSRRLR
jgi:hypothetical protein